MEETNFLSISNNAKVQSCSSQAKSCGASNVLSPDRKTIWLSETGLPQHLIIDLSQLSKKSKEIKCFGIYCWHAYNTNPKLIELYFSKDNKSYIYFNKFSVSLKPGTQYFAIDPVDTNLYKSIKIVVKETYGGLKTYINQISLYEDIPEIEYKKSNNDSKKSFSTCNINNSRQVHVKNNKSHLLRNELEDKNEEIKFNDNEETNKHLDTDSEESIHNTPQKIYNLQDLSRISKEASKPILKKEYSPLTTIRLEKDKNELEKVLDGRSLNSHSILNHNKAHSIDQVVINRNSRTTEDKNSKTLEDQLKEMESHLMKLKLDQTTDDALRSNNGKFKAMTITDEKFSKDKESISSKLNLIKGNLNFSSFNNSENLKLFIGDDLKKSNSHYSLQTNKAINGTTNDDKIARLERELSNLNTKFENLQEEVNNLKKAKASVTEKNMETIINECKKFISSMITNNTKDIGNCYNQNKNSNYNLLTEKDILNSNSYQKSRLNYSSDVGNEYQNKSNNNTKDIQEENIEKSNLNDNLELNNILDVKFDALVKNIEEKINNTFLQPSLNNIEKSLKSNIEDLRDKISSISNTIPSKSSNKLVARPIQNQAEYEPEKSINNKSKLENIQSIAEKLHEKLNEKVFSFLNIKEKKLSLLQQQTNYYLKGKKNILSSPISNFSDNY